MAAGISANTSAAGGPLRPTTNAPLADLDLDLVLQGLVRDLTGLDGKLIRPRFQPDDETGKSVPRIPNQNEEWAAVGVLSIVPDDNPAQAHDSTGDGATTLISHETVEGLASFYGPKAEGYAALVRDGLFIAQNREALFHLGMALLDVGPLRRLSGVVNTRARRQVDLPIRLRRRVERTYAILNLRSAHGRVRADGSRILAQPFETTPPET